MNRRDIVKEWHASPLYTDIGRPGFWGNPFKLDMFGGDRAACLTEYERHLRGDPRLLARLPELLGQFIVCHCHPLQCHGDILVKLCRELTLP